MCQLLNLLLQSGVLNAEPCELTYQNYKIEQFNSLKYLGIEFCQYGNTNVARNDLYKRGFQAYFKLVRSLQSLPKPVNFTSFV